MIYGRQYSTYGKLPPNYYRQFPISGKLPMKYQQQLPKVRKLRIIYRRQLHRVVKLRMSSQRQFHDIVKLRINYSKQTYSQKFPITTRILRQKYRRSKPIYLIYPSFYKKNEHSKPFLMEGVISIQARIAWALSNLIIYNHDTRSNYLRLL